MAVLITTAFFVIGWVGLLYVDEDKGRAAAEAWREDRVWSQEVVPR